MKITPYSIKPFPTNVHKAKTVCRHRFHHHQKKQNRSSGDDDPAGRVLLDAIVFKAEFTNFCKLGPFYLYAILYRCRAPPAPSFP